MVKIERDESLYEEQIKRTKGLKDVKVASTPNGIMPLDKGSLMVKSEYGIINIPIFIEEIKVSGDLNDFTYFITVKTHEKYVRFGENVTDYDIENHEEIVQEEDEINILKLFADLIGEHL